MVSHFQNKMQILIYSLTMPVQHYISFVRGKWKTYISRTEISATIWRRDPRPHSGASMGPLRRESSGSQESVWRTCNNRRSSCVPAKTLNPESRASQSWKYLLHELSHTGFVYDWQVNLQDLLICISVKYQERVLHKFLSSVSCINVILLNECPILWVGNGL